MSALGTGFRVRWSGRGSARRGRAGAVRGRGGARPNGGGCAGAGEFGGCRFRPAPAENSGGGSKRVALAAGCAPRWWASPEQPPSSVSGAGRRAAEGCVWRGLLLHRREAPQRPPVEGPRGETEAGSRVLYPRSRDSPGLAGYRDHRDASCGAAGRGAPGASGTVQSGLGSQAWRAPCGLAAREVLFCFRGIGAESPVRETIGTLDLERRVIDVGRRGAGVPEGPVECRLWDRTAWVHIPAPQCTGCDLGDPGGVSVAPSEKWVVRNVL